MRKLAGIGSLIFLVMVLAGTSLAADPNTGCGLGTMLFAENDGLLSQVGAVTTNSLFGNQTFGITFGTLDCNKPAAFASNEKLNKFVADNMDNLAADMAKGDGEYLDTLAMLMEVPQAERTTCYAKLQSNFSNIFTSESVTSQEIVTNIESVLTLS
jgi:hypothetical protein